MMKNMNKHIACHVIFAAASRSNNLGQPLAGPKFSACGRCCFSVIGLVFMLFFLSKSVLEEVRVPDVGEHLDVVTKVRKLAPDLDQRLALRVDRHPSRNCSQNEVL
jgi:hypothetical protein